MLSFLAYLNFSFSIVASYIILSYLYDSSSLSLIAKFNYFNTLSASLHNYSVYFNF